MGVDGLNYMNDDEAAKACIAAVKQLSKDVGIPADLKGILKDEDVRFLSESAYADACRPGNPRDTSVEEIEALYNVLPYTVTVDLDGGEYPEGTTDPAGDYDYGTEFPNFTASVSGNTWTLTHK